MAKQISHQIVFRIVFFIGAAGFLLGLFYWIDVLVEIIKWTGPIGLGLLVIGGTGMWITSKRHQMKKLKMEQVEIKPDEGGQEEEPAQLGSRFQDYITSPEEGVTVYTLFFAGVIVIIWGIIMVFRWFRAIF
jgi:hypothetical protein